MSAVAGIVHLRGAPVDGAAIANLTAAMAHLGPDGTYIVTAGPVAFGHCMMWTTPESQHECLPLEDAAAGVLLTADARIDNRQELADKLGLQPRLHEMADSELILAAYIRWGAACVEHLLGAFAFAIWDAQRQTLLCATDHLNTRPLHYYQDAERFIFSSEVRGLLAAPDVPKRLDEHKLAVSALTFVDLQEKERTYFQDIRQLGAATTLEVTAQGTQRRRYWQLDPMRRLPYRRDDEWLEAFRTEMFAAIDTCTRTAYPAAAMLSGGLDSSGIVSVAARRMAETGRGLITVSAVNADAMTSPFPDERDYIELFREWPNIELVSVTAPERGPFDNLEQLVRQRMSPIVDSRHFLMSALTEAATTRQARTLLVGIGGEFGPSMLGRDFLTELFVKGAWWRLACEVRFLRRREGRPLKQYFSNQILRPLLPPAFVNRVRPQPNPWPVYQPLRHDYVEAVLGKQCWQAPEHNQWLPSWPDHRHKIVELFESVEVLDFFETYVGYETIRLWFPYFNKRLIEFCLAAPGHLKIRNGYRRYLIRAGLEGIMPPAIQWRTTKEPFSPDYQLRFARQQEQVQEFFAAIGHRDPIRDFVDVARLETIAAHEVAMTPGAIGSQYLTHNVLPRAVSLIHFLRSF